LKKSGQKPAFPLKSKAAVPKTEVLELPLMIKFDKSSIDKIKNVSYTHIIEYNGSAAL
jgi:hypothetical protein